MIVSRVLASLAHLGLVLGLLGIGWRHFDRPLTGMAMAACYLLLPYTRMALVDSAQLIPSALIVAAVFWHLRPALAGALIGLAAGWMPACLGLIALWCGFFGVEGQCDSSRLLWRLSSAARSSAGSGRHSWAIGAAGSERAASPKSVSCPIFSPRLREASG